MLNAASEFLKDGKKWPFYILSYVLTTQYRKVRWRVHKTGIRCHGFDIVDDIWKTCCALHNISTKIGIKVFKVNGKAR
jgi:hypothetical protein